MSLDDFWRVEVALGSAPYASSQTYTDITSQVRGLSLRRQRGDSFGQVTPALASIVVDNRDARWSGSSTYSAAPYAGNVIPDRRVRLSARASTGDSFTVMATLFLEGVDDAAGVDDSTAVLRCSGILRLLAQAQPVRLLRAAELTGQRVSALLTRANVPSGLRGTIDNGTVMVDRQLLDGQVLGLLQELARCERGVLTEDALGRIEFRDRFHWIDAANLNTSQFTISASAMRQRVVQHRNSAFDTVRSVAASGASATTVQYSSTYAPADFPDTVHQELGLPILFDGDVEVVAETVQKTAEPLDADQSNPSAVTVLMATTGATAAASTSWQVELLELVTVQYRPLGWSSDRSALCRVEAIEHAVTGEAWTMTLGLSPANNRWRDDAVDYFYEYGDAITAAHRGSL